MSDTVQNLPNRSSVQIEVYEWKEGHPRPGTANKDPALELLEVPNKGQVPVPGDVLHIHCPGDPGANILELVQFRVIERELLWSGRFGDDDDGQTPLEYLKMWIHVRRIHDYYPTKIMKGRFRQT